MKNGPGKRRPATWRDPAAGCAPSPFSRSVISRTEQPATSKNERDPRNVVFEDSYKLGKIITNVGQRESPRRSSYPCTCSVSVAIIKILPRTGSFGTFFADLSYLPVNVPSRSR